MAIGHAKFPKRVIPFHRNVLGKVRAVLGVLVVKIAEQETRDKEGGGQSKSTAEILFAHLSSKANPHRLIHF